MHDPAHRLGFVLLPGCGLMAAGAAFDALRAANAWVDGVRYQPLLLSAGNDDDGAPLPLPPLAAAPPLHGLFVVAARLPDAGEALPPGLDAALAQVDAAGGVLGGIGTGAAWLAHAGRLDGHRCTVPARHAEAVSARYPGVTVSRHLYELDRARATCAHGTASLDMAIAWLGQRHGHELVQQLLMHFGLERLRPSDEPQHASRPAMLRANPKLAEAIALMEANIGEPLSTQDIATLIGVSRRQLERLFKQHLDTLPSRWYLEKRLDHARRLLQQTSRSILQIGLSSGFSSGAHFSNAYRACYGRTPRDERSARAVAWRDAATDTTRAERPGTPA